MLSTINEYQGEAKPQHKISKIKSNNFAKETQEILKYINWVIFNVIRLKYRYIHYW